MATIRITDTGAEVRPIELTDGAGGVVAGGLPGGSDALSGATRSLVVYRLAYNGATWDRLRTPNRFVPVDLASATAETAVWTPAAGKRFRLMGLVVKTSVATKLTFRDGTGGTIVAVLELDTAPRDLLLGNGILSAAANNPLTITRSVAATLAGTLFGVEES